MNGFRGDSAVTRIRQEGRTGNRIRRPARVPVARPRGLRRETAGSGSGSNTGQSTGPDRRMTPVTRSRVRGALPVCGISRTDAMRGGAL